MTHVSGKPDVMGPMVARIKELFEEVANTKPKAVCDDALLSPAHTKKGGRGGRGGRAGGGTGGTRAGVCTLPCSSAPRSTPMVGCVL